MVYLRLLRVPRLGPVLGAVILGRLSVGVNALALILFLSAARGSFAVAGAVAGALALGTGLGAPLAGRLADRLGLVVLAPLAGLHAAGLVGLALLGAGDAPVAALGLLALATGATVPPSSAILRAAYPALLHDHRELLPIAFALDSVVNDLLFVLGPLLVSVIVAVSSARTALLLASVTVVSGTLLFLLLLPGDVVVRVAPVADRRRRLLGALASPSTRILVAAILPVGIAFGIVDVVLPAFAQAEGRPHVSGLLLALWSASSAAAGLVYGLQRGTRSLSRLHLAFAVALPLFILPLLAADSMLTMALAVVVAGLPVGPLIAVRNELAGRTAARGSATESYTWIATSTVGGVAVGVALGGMLVGGPGWRVATLLAVVIAALGAAWTIAGRATLDAALRRPTQHGRLAD